MRRSILNSTSWAIFLYSNDGINYKLDNPSAAYVMRGDLPDVKSVHVAKYWIYCAVHSSTAGEKEAKDMYELAKNERWDDTWYHGQYFTAQHYTVQTKAPKKLFFDSNSPNTDLKYFQTGETV